MITINSRNGSRLSWKPFCKNTGSLCSRQVPRARRGRRHGAAPASWNGWDAAELSASSAVSQLARPDLSSSSLFRVPHAATSHQPGPLVAFMQPCLLFNFLVSFDLSNVYTAFPVLKQCPVLQSHYFQKRQMIYSGGSQPPVLCPGMWKAWPYKFPLCFCWELPAFVPPRHTPLQPFLNMQKERGEGGDLMSNISTFPSEHRLKHGEGLGRG